MAKDDKKKKEEEAKEEKEEEKEGKEKEGEEKEGEEEDDAEGEEGGEEGAEGEEGGKKKKKKKKSSKKKKLILVGVALVVTLAIAVPAVLFLTGHLGGKKEAVEGAAVEEGADGKGAAGQAVFYDMEEFIVNLNVGSKRPSFLKMTVSLEVENELQIPTIEKNMPRMRDSFQVYLRELRQDDLQGSAGLYRLREELLLRVNKVAYPAKVNDILFKEILVQ